MKTQTFFSQPGLGILTLALLLFTLPVSTSAVTIGFEGSGVAPNGVISPVPLPYSESGFVLSNGTPAAESGIFGSDIDGEPNSGSDFFGWAFNGTIVLEHMNGDAFTLNSFDAGHIGAIGSLPANLPLTVTGNLQGGGVVVANFMYTNPWQTFVLPNTFTGLSSVEFYNSFDGDTGLDNIVVNATAVPDTGSSLALALLGGLALVIAYRRRGQAMA